MDAKLEQALEIVRQMPDEDQDRIGLWLLDYIAWLEKSEEDDEKKNGFIGQ
jgi:hypothetical protein